jgi:hypothetical protein
MPSILGSLSSVADGSMVEDVMQIAGGLFGGSTK